MGLFQCPHCGTSYTLGEQLEGREVRCHHCQRTVRISFIQHSRDNLPASPHSLYDGEVTGPPTANPMSAVSQDQLTPSTLAEVPDSPSSAHYNQYSPSHDQHNAYYSTDQLPASNYTEAQKAELKKTARPMSFTDLEQGIGAPDGVGSQTSLAAAPPTPHSTIHVGLVGWCAFLLLALVFPTITPAKDGEIIMHWAWSLPTSATSQGSVIFFYLFWCLASIAGITVSLVVRGPMRGLVLCVLAFVLVMLNPVAQISRSGFFPTNAMSRVLSDAHLTLLLFWLSLTGTISGSQLASIFPEHRIPRLIGGISGMVLLFSLLYPFFPGSKSLLELLFLLGASVWTVPLFGLSLVTMGIIASLQLGGPFLHGEKRAKTARALGKIVVFVSLLLSVALFAVMALYTLTRGKHATLFFIFVALKLFGLCYSILFISSLSLSDSIGLFLEQRRSEPIAPLSEAIQRRLHTLLQLKQDGLLTEDEYQSKRRQFLDNL